MRKCQPERNSPLKLPAAVILLTALVLVAGSGAQTSHAAAAVPFQHHASALPYVGSATAQPAPPPVSYDEQIGMTFAQSFTALSYNVTAVLQTDSDGYGPAYLLNGVTDGGYWYQIGITYNWPGDVGYLPGWALVYEVWDNAGNTIFPASGGGGLANLTGPVNGGDSVLLSLRFSGGQVQMTVRDWNTGATGSEPYRAHGTTFVGLPTTSDSNGYFTGPMTEWYHASPYYATDRAVVYYNPQTPLTSADVWADEFNTNTLTPLFGSDLQLTFTNPDQFLSFSTNGAEIRANAYTFITGASSQSTLSLDYSVIGGGSGYSAPTLTYVFNGTRQTATLTGTAATYSADIGTSWSVSATLPGGTPDERWATSQPGGVVSSPLTQSIAYYHQFLAPFIYRVSGGTGYSAPSIRTSALGGSSVLIGNTSAWVDAGATFAYPAALPGSSATQRWVTQNYTGTVTSPAPVTVQYLLQYGLALSYSIVGGGFPGAPTVSAVQYGKGFTSSLTNSTAYFVDPGSEWSVTALLPGSSTQERWVTIQSSSGIASAPETLVFTYRHQYMLAIAASPAAGGTTGQTAGWTDAGSTVQLSQAASEGWKFEGWTGSGAGSYTGSSNSTDIVVGAPINETASYYPGLSVLAGPNGALTYTYGGTRGVVQGGSSATIFAAPGTVIVLGATPSSFFYSFSGWGIGATGSGPSTTLTLSSPASVQGTFALDMTAVGVITGVVMLAGISVALVIRSMRRPRHKIKTLHPLPLP